jgi:hypothetical protein
MKRYLSDEALTWLVVIAIVAISLVLIVVMGHRATSAVH